MSLNAEEFQLTLHRDRQTERREARQRMVEALIAGNEIDPRDVALARGLVLKERENSIFSDVWVPLATLFLLIALFSGRGLALLTLGTALLLIVGVSVLWKNYALTGVSYRRHYDRTRAFPGEPVTMTLNIGNYKRLPLTWLQFQDELPVSPELDSAVSQAAAEASGRYDLQSTFSLGPYEETEREVTLYFPKRGYYSIGPVTYESGDIFTLFTVAKQFDNRDRIVIYPTIYPLEALGLPPKEPFGDLRVRRSLFSDPIKTRGIRNYQPQDRFRDVHWKATARRGALQTKIYDPSTGMTLVVFLNVATFAKAWMGFEPAQLERAVSVAASVAYHGTEQDWAVGVFANGSVPSSDQPIKVLPNRSPDQPSHILEALAAVTEFATGSIERLMVQQSGRLPWAATLVLVTAVLTDEILVTLLRLKEAGRRVVIISLASEPPPTTAGQLLIYHVPPKTAVFHPHTQTEAALGAIPTPQPIVLNGANA